MQNIYKLFLLALISITSLTSCATIVHGTRQSIGIASNPSNAMVWVDRTFIGNTPIVVEMTRKDNHIVTIALDGYEPYEAVFSRRLSGWAFGNVIFGGIFGLAIDAISGAVYTLTPEQIQVELRSNRIAYTKNSKDSFITIVLEADPSWQKIGNLVAVN